MALRPEGGGIRLRRWRERRLGRQCRPEQRRRSSGQRRWRGKERAVGRWRRTGRSGGARQGEARERRCTARGAVRGGRRGWIQVALGVVPARAARGRRRRSGRARKLRAVGPAAEGGAARGGEPVRRVGASGGSVGHRDGQGGGNRRGARRTPAGGSKGRMRRPSFLRRRSDRWPRRGWSAAVDGLVTGEMVQGGGGSARVSSWRPGFGQHGSTVAAVELGAREEEDWGRKKLGRRYFGRRL